MSSDSSIGVSFNPSSGTLSVTLSKEDGHALAIALHAAADHDVRLAPRVERLRTFLDVILGVSPPGSPSRESIPPATPPGPDDTILQGVRCTEDCGWPATLHTAPCQANRRARLKERQGRTALLPDME